MYFDIYIYGLYNCLNKKNIKIIILCMRIKSEIKVKLKKEKNVPAFYMI